MMNHLKDIQGILFDLDGVLYVGSKPIPGAVEAVKTIKNSGISCRFITNTSTLSLNSLQQKLHQLGFDVERHEILSAPQAALIYLRQFNNPSCYLLLAEDVKQDFYEIKQSASQANYIIIGDIGKQWNYSLLDQVFNRLIDGAELIAMHKNRFWKTETGLQMDIGGFITALEYASDRKSVLIGKPSPNFFKMALLDMGLKASETAIIGDDIDSDVGGAQTIQIFGILVKTGKYRQAYTDKSTVTPDLILNSIQELPKALGIY